MEELAFGLAFLVPVVVIAEPVARDDRYEVHEDLTLHAVSGPIVSTGFDSGAAGAVALAGDWDYLDRIENSEGAGQSYPTDGAGRDWRSANFDKATSTIGPWGTAAAPLQGGTIDGFPAATPVILEGIGDAPNGLNLITTYLFRNTFQLTRAQAAQTIWTANLLVDDGCVIYINGVEVGAVNMPEGPVTTETFASQSLANESDYVLVALNAAGAVVAGTNTIAVEVHQATSGSSDVGLDLSLLSGEGSTGGFVYVDDVFGTAHPDYSDGSLEGNGGFSGGGLHVEILGRDSRQVADPLAASGGFVRAFTLAAAATVDISLRYRLTTADALEQQESGEAVLAVNGIRYGNDLNDSLAHINDGGDSGWQTASFSIPLAAGAHTLTLGAFSDTTSRGDENVDVYFDDVIATVQGGGGGGALDNDTVGANPSAVVVTNPAHGTLNFPADGIFTYTPNANFFGQDRFTYQVTDATGTSPPATVTIDVQAINDPPVAADDFYTTPEDVNLLVANTQEYLFANDQDVEYDILSAVLENDVTHGTLLLDPSGFFLYTPDPNFFGTDRFTYFADDGTDRSAPATVTIEVTSTPDPPDPRADSYETEENQSLVVTLLDPGSGEVETVVPYGAEWKYNDTGTDLGIVWRQRAYDDSQWPSGPAELGYGDGDEATTVGFGGNASDVHPTTYFRRTFDVTAAAAIIDATVWVHRDDGIVVYLNGVQIGIDNVQANPSYGTYADNAGDDGNAEIGFDQIDPALFVEGANTLAVEIHQNTPGSSDISFDLRMEVTRANAFGLLANDTDPDGLALIAELVSDPAHGAVALNPDGSFTYTPAINYEGTDSFVYRANNGTLSAEATVTITITPGPNDIPVTVPDSYFPVEETRFTRNAAMGVLANDVDPDGDFLSALLKTSTAHGTLFLNPDGSFVYTPDDNFFGSDSFTYAAFDGTAESPPETVTLNVSNTPDPPLAQPESYATDPGQEIFVSSSEGVLVNDRDPDGSGLTAQLVTDVSAGTLQLYPTGAFTYTPANDNPGSVTFIYRANDGALNSAPTTVTIYLDSAPVAGNDHHETAEDEVLSVTASDGVLKNDTDAENDTLTASLVAPPANGNVALNTNGSFTYVPNRDFEGNDVFTYRARDAHRESAPATVTIEVTPVNDPPAALADSYLATADQVFVVNASAGVLANDRDPDDALFTAAVASLPRHGALVLGPDGSFVYTPAIGYSGPDSFSYTASDGLLDSPPATVTITVGGASDSIVINEIMYHPSSELDAHEFIELANRGDGPVNLENWSFTSGLTYTFPEVTIPAGGFLIVAADPAEFTAQYGPVDHLVGGWSGSLSNRGERIRLADQNGDQVDELEYSDQGDWATRTRVQDAGEPGWTWEAAHDGGGSSLELVYPRLTNKAGQNWLSSNGPPTPGAPNSVLLPESAVAPLILDVEHTPRVPRSTDTVTIRASLRDTTLAGLRATLFYRISANPAPVFATTAMADDGLHDDGEANDGIFGVALPAMANGTIVEFYVSATDGSNARTWPAPTSIGQVANALYQVDDEVPPGGQGIYRLIMTVSEEAAFVGIDRDSNAQMHCTLVADDCTGPVVRHLCGMRVRGASSRADNPVPMRVNIPRDTPWNGITQMNLNSQFTWLQFIGMKLFQASDLPAPDSKRIAMRRNGQDYTRGQMEDYGSLVQLQPPNAEFVDAKFPGDSQGNLYKKVRPDVDWAYRSGNLARYAQDGWGKQTNESEDDWSDLDEFLRVMNEAPGAPDYIAQVEAVANLDQWLRWFAVEALIANGETNASNGADDDYSMYRGVSDPRFVFIPHDLDTILGHGDGSRITDPQHTIFDMAERGDTLAPLVPLFNDPSIRTRYYQVLRELIETSFSKARFDGLLFNHLTGWVPENVIDDVITFMDARRNFVAGIVDAELGPAGPRPVPTTLVSLPGPHGSLYLSELMAVNVSAFSFSGKFRDYIELHNSGPTARSLAGYSLSDDPFDPRKFVFPAGTSIGAGQYLMLYADSDSAPGIHLGFGLSSDGEIVSLYDAAGTLLDTVTFGVQIPNYPIGRTGPGTDTWSLNRPTPAGANAVQALGSPATLLINEWLTKPDVVFNEDFIELYNPDRLPVSLGGLAISDDPLNNPQRAVLPALSFIQGGGFALLEAVGSANVTPGNGAELPFKLAADQGWIAIYGENLVEIDRVHSFCLFRDESQGRETDGAPFYADFALPTPGVSNITDLTAENEILRSLRITEIMYHPPSGSDAEFIELRNVGSNPINLGGVAFTKGLDFEFPNMTLNPGQHVVVVANQAVFQSIYGFGINIAGEWSGKLDNDQDRIRLEIEALNAAILDFTYVDQWYPSTDGGGYSLVIIDEHAPPSSWDEKRSWTAGGTLNGSPGVASGFFVFAGPDQKVTLPATATLNATVLYGPLDPQTVSLSWSLENGPAVAQFGSPANEDTIVTVPTAGRYLFELTATPQAGPVMVSRVTVVFQDSYENWAIQYFGSPAVAAADKLADFDVDGLANVLEFVLGLDPTRPDGEGLLEPSVTEEPGGFLSMVYFRRYVRADEVTIIPEVSSDLQIWRTGPGFLSETVLGSTGDGELVRVVDLVPQNSARARFLRLRVECSN